MAENGAEGAKPSENGQVVDFGTVTKFVPCSWNECLAGHRWPPTVAVVKCGGCQGPVLAQRMENCPYCNEPIKGVNLRNDYIPQGGGVARRCQGEKPYGETLDLELKREIWGSEGVDGKTSEAKG